LGILYFFKGTESLLVAAGLTLVFSLLSVIFSVTVTVTAEVVLLLLLLLLLLMPLVSSVVFTGI